MIIKFVKRKDIIDRYLDQINSGKPLTKEQKSLIKGLNK